MEYRSKPSRFVIVSVAIAGILLIGIIIAALVLTSKNPYGEDEITIDGISNVSNITPDITASVYAQLYKIAKENTKGDLPADIKAKLREGTVEEKYDTDSKTYIGTFIVDLEELKQSYYVGYRYKTTGTTGSGYPVFVSCPPQKYRIYDTPCSDGISLYEHADPIFIYAPYDSYEKGFEVKFAREPEDYYDVPELNVYLITCTDTRIPGLKQKFLDWMTSNGLDPENYTINYSSC